MHTTNATIIAKEDERRKTALVEVVTVHCGRGAALRAVAGTSC